MRYLGILLLIVVGMGSPAFADRLHLSNGEVVDVARWRIEGDQIIFERFGGEISIPRSEVQRIEPTLTAPPSTRAPATTSPRSGEPIGPGAAGADSLIERQCELRWPKDYSMRVHCEQSERRAARELQEPVYDGTPSQVAAIQRRCADRWPKDFSMRLHCQESEIRAIKELRK